MTLQLLSNSIRHFIDTGFQKGRRSLHDQGEDIVLSLIPEMSTVVMHVSWGA